jgi:hypothetical protein
VTSPENGPSNGAGSDLPTEAIPAMIAPRRTAPKGERIDLPEIVPATEDAGSNPAHPKYVRAQSSVDLDAPVTSTYRATPTDPAPEGVIPVVPILTNSGLSSLRGVSRRPRVRRVTRVVRYIDTWSVFKVAALFSLAAYFVALTSGVLLWRVAASTGTLDNVERWFTQFGWETFELDGGAVYHNAWIAGLFVVVALTGVAVLMAALFNLISDLVGGVRVSVLEEEVVAVGPTRTTIRRGESRGEGGVPG